MALGFDFDQLMQSPAFQMGIGMLAQPRSWENRGFAGVAQGALQGMQNTQQARQFAVQRKMQEQQLADAAAKKEAATRKMSLLKDAATAYMLKQPKPRPMAFNPQPGDEAVRDQFAGAQTTAKMIEAGIDPSEIAAFSKVMNPSEEDFTLAPDAQRFRGGKLIAENTRPENGKPIIENHYPISATMERPHISYDQGRSWLPMPNSQPRPIFNPREGTNLTVKMPASFDAAGKLRDDYRQDTKTIRELGSTADTIETLLDNAPSAANDLAIQRQVSSLFNAGQRAASEVQAWRNFGNLPTRIVGSLNRFASGQYTSTQRNELRALVKSMKDTLVVPSEGAVNEFYGGIADSYQVPRTQVFGPKTGVRKQDTGGWGIKKIE